MPQDDTQLIFNVLTTVVSDYYNELTRYSYDFLDNRNSLARTNITQLIYIHALLEIHVPD